MKKRITGLLKPFAYLLIGNKLSPEKYVDQIAPSPLLVIHAKDDPVVSYRHAEKLIKKANEPKELWTLDNGGHTAALGPHAQTCAPVLHRKFMAWVNAH